MATLMNYWLMKSEPDTYSIEDLAKDPKHIEPWDGIRNYQARNFMRDDMQVGDLAFFYHSNCAEPGIVGIMEVAKLAFPDHTQFDPESNYHDPKSDPDNPRWVNVGVRYIRHTKRNITLAELKEHPALSEFRLVKKGNRLSILPVEKADWDFVLSLE